jgi:hypothetical protein
MEKRYAIIDNGVVINIALWDGVSLWDSGFDQVIDVTNTECEIGYTYADLVFTPPETQGE